MPTTSEQGHSHIISILEQRFRDSDTPLTPLNIDRYSALRALFTEAPGSSAFNSAVATVGAELRQPPDTVDLEYSSFANLARKSVRATVLENPSIERREKLLALLDPRDETDFQTLRDVSLYDLNATIRQAALRQMSHSISTEVVAVAETLLRRDRDLGVVQDAGELLRRFVHVAFPEPVYGNNSEVEIKSAIYLTVRRVMGEISVNDHKLLGGNLSLGEIRKRQALEIAHALMWSTSPELQLADPGLSLERGKNPKNSIKFLAGDIILQVFWNPFQPLSVREKAIDLSFDRAKTLHPLATLMYFWAKETDEAGDKETAKLRCSVRARWQLENLPLLRLQDPYRNLRN